MAKLSHQALLGTLTRDMDRGKFSNNFPLYVYIDVYITLTFNHSTRRRTKKCIAEWKTNAAHIVIIFLLGNHFHNMQSLKTQACLIQTTSWLPADSLRWMSGCASTRLSGELGTNLEAQHNSMQNTCLSLNTYSSFVLLHSRLCWARCGQMGRTKPEYIFF